jgi:hypothetical protein
VAKRQRVATMKQRTGLDLAKDRGVDHLDAALDRKGTVTWRLSFFQLGICIPGVASGGAQSNSCSDR